MKSSQFFLYCEAFLTVHMHIFFCQTIKGFWGPVLKSITLYAPTKIKMVSKKLGLMCASVCVLGLTHNHAHTD